MQRRPNFSRGQVVLVWDAGSGCGLCQAVALEEGQAQAGTGKVVGLGGQGGAA